MFRLSDKVYTILKWGIIIFLPACSVLYQALSKIYGLPCANEVSGTISAICVFLGTILCISSAEYNKDDRQRELEEAIKELKKKDKTPKVEPIVEPIIEPKVVLYSSEEPKEELIELQKEEPSVQVVDEVKEEDKFIVGQNYKIIAERGLRVRETPNGRNLSVDELTEDGKKHAVDNNGAVLLKDTLCSCIECKGNWLRIPSGWICGIADDGENYVEAYTENPAVQAIRYQLSLYTDPLNQGFYNLCLKWCRIVYANAGFDIGIVCCANHRRDINAQSGNPNNADMVFSGANFRNGTCGSCGRQFGHVGIYMDGFVYGAQAPYKMTFEAWKNTYGYGGHSNCNMW